MPTDRRPFIAAVLALGATLAACGTTTQVAETSTATEGTFRIGLEAPLSGSQAKVGEGMLRGAEMAAAELNDQGGIDGRTVEIVPIDDEADPEAGLAAATAAIAAGLDAVVGPYNSGVGTQTLPLYLEAGLVPLRLTSADTTAGLGFTLQPMTSQIAPTAVTAIQEWAGASSVGIIVDSTQDYTVKAAATMQELLTAADITVTGSEEISPGASSYPEAVAAALAGQPDLIYVVTYYPEAGAIARELASSPEVACLIDYGGFDNGYIDAAGLDAAQHCPVVGVPAPDDFADAAEFIATYQELFDAAPGAWSPYTYDSVLLLADAVERAGGTDADALTAALAATEGWTGWTGAVAFEAGTGNREPAPVTVTAVDATGAFHVDESWAAAVGFGR